MIICINLKNLGITEHDYGTGLKEVGGEYILKSDGIYKKDTSVKTLNQEIDTAYIKNSVRATAYDFYIERSPDIVECSVEVESKEGLITTGTIPQGWTKSDLGKGLKSRFLRYKVKANSPISVQDCRVVIVETERLL